MKTVILAVLDGWGLGSQNETNPIHVADPETIKYIEKYYPAGALNASGVSVGLPWGEEGNSEVGHLTIGAGRVLYQNFLKITKSIQRGDFYKNNVLRKAFHAGDKNGGDVHLVGLLTDGSVHASIEHLKALIEMAKREDVSNLYLHLFTDGKDSSPKSSLKLISELNTKIKETGVGQIASISGRYYGMDRKDNWDRTEKAYKALIGEAPESTIEEAITAIYDKNLNDEYVEPHIIGKAQPIKSDDSIIFFNFREDSIRQIVHPFVDSSFSKFEIKQFSNLSVATFTQYDKRFNVPIAFPPEKIKNTLGEVLAQHDRTQLRIAETEKGAHVTYFFNGLKDTAFENEFRILIPSSDIVNMKENPTMRAGAITERVIISMQDGSFNFILVNYPNADIMAHTGDYNATKSAVQVIDRQINRLLRASLEGDHTLIITSDHGNAEVVYDPQTGGEETKHNTSPVPFYVVNKKYQNSDLGSPGDLPKIGILADVAPTILDIMNIEKPPEMTGSSLIDFIE